MFSAHCAIFTIYSCFPARSIYFLARRRFSLKARSDSLASTWLLSGGLELCWVYSVRTRRAFLAASESLGRPRSLFVCVCVTTLSCAVLVCILSFSMRSELSVRSVPACVATGGIFFLTILLRELVSWPVDFIRLHWVALFLNCFGASGFGSWNFLSAFWWYVLD